MTAPKRRLSVVALSAVVALIPTSAADAYDTSYTDLPELQTATVVSTRSAADSSVDSPAGTTIAFRFDEPVDGSTLDPSTFVVYDQQGHRSSAAQATVADDTVTATFPDIDTAEEEAALTMAASQAGAVRGVDGDASPIGSAGLIRWRSRTASGPQDCLALRHVTGPRYVHGNTTMRVVFAACSEGPWSIRARGFRLQMVDGRSIAGIRVRSLSAYPMAGTVVFPGLRYRPRIARLTVATGAVSYWTYDAGETEAEGSVASQAWTISHHGTTVRPDLVSVKLLPNARADRPDHAVFVFDQKVSRPTAGRFRLDDVATGTRAVVLRAHPRQVRVTFKPQAAKAATFAAVRAGAVRSGQADEVAVPNVLWWPQYSRERTALPDLYSAPFWYDDTTGTPVLTAAFEFDTALAESTSTADFHLYDQAGVRYDADRCTVTNSTDLPQPMGTATCTFPTAPVWGQGVHTATVGANAVHDDAGLGNPEAARQGYPK